MAVVVMTGPFRDDLRFELAGTDVQLELLTGGEAGLALALELKGDRRRFGRDDITLRDLGIGTLVTVELEREAEKSHTDFSVVLPGVELYRTDNTEDLSVLAVRTVHDDGQPVDPTTRVLQTYAVFRLGGSVTLLWSAEKRTVHELCHLWVKGVCRFPRPGYTVELRPAEQQGQLPKERRLELLVKEPPVQTPGGPATVVADYYELACSEVDIVTILPEATNAPQGRSIVVVEDTSFIPAHEYSCGNWKATQEPISSSGEYELIVEGSCDIPVTLVPARSRPTNPEHLWLDIDDRESPTGSRRPRYTRRTRSPYSRVVILPEGRCIDLPPDHGAPSG
jgi:hypothetical protein